MLLLSVIIEYFTHDEIKNYYAQLNPIIEAYLGSNEPALKRLSIETVNKLSSTPKAVSVLSQYKNLIPLVLQALDLNDEDLIRTVFETFNEFVEYKKVIRPHLELIIKAALTIVRNPDHADNLREVTLLFLELIAEKYARVMLKNHGVGFISEIMAAGFSIASEDPSTWEGKDKHDTPPMYAAEMMRQYCVSLPNEKVWAAVSAKI